MKLGLALSGGGIRGVAHIGFLEAMEENNIKFDIVGGTSSGSIVATCYAIGFNPYYIYILFKRYAEEIANINLKPFKLGIGGIFGNIKSKKAVVNGLRSGEDLEKVVYEITKAKNIYKIKDIKMPIVIPAVDIVNKKEIIFTNKIPKNKNNKKYIDNITIGKAIRASSSFPVAFAPCDIEEILYLDGGLLNSLPADEVKLQGADKIVGLRFKSDPISKKSDLMDILIVILDIIGAKVSEESILNTDIIVDVYTDRVGLLDFNKIDMCYEYGYNEGLKQIKKIKELKEE